MTNVLPHGCRRNLCSALRPHGSPLRWRSTVFASATSWGGRQRDRGNALQRPGLVGFVNPALPARPSIPFCGYRRLQATATRYSLGTRSVPSVALLRRSIISTISARHSPQRPSGVSRSRALTSGGHATAVGTNCPRPIGATTRLLQFLAVPVTAVCKLDLVLGPRAQRSVACLPCSASGWPSSAYWPPVDADDRVPV
jgi:hypothetical protein